MAADCIQAMKEALDSNARRSDDESALLSAASANAWLSAAFDSALDSSTDDSARFSAAPLTAATIWASANDFIRSALVKRTPDLRVGQRVTERRCRERRDHLVAGERRLHRRGRQGRPHLVAGQRGLEVGVGERRRIAVFQRGAEIDFREPLAEVTRTERLLHPDVGEGREQVLVRERSGERRIGQRATHRRLVQRGLDGAIRQRRLHLGLGQRRTDLVAAERRGERLVGEQAARGRRRRRSGCKAAANSGCCSAPLICASEKNKRSSLLESSLRAFGSFRIRSNVSLCMNACASRIAERDVFAGDLRRLVALGRADGGVGPVRHRRHDPGDPQAREDDHRRRTDTPDDLRSARHRILHTGTGPRNRIFDRIHSPPDEAPQARDPATPLRTRQRPALPS